MITPKEIVELVDRFDRNRDSYRSGSYNETQLRREFLDPFFEVLGWDVSNKRGYAEAYKDVIHEGAIKIGGATKAPDYCFRIGGTRKFFLEAKKPSVDIKGDTHPAYQLRRYAWSAKLPLSILTDFEEFAVYDCRVRPTQADRAAVARIFYINYADYIDRWNEIDSVYSRDSVLRGSFDEYVESSKGKRGTSEIDSSFLEEIESWRTALARNIALRNPSLSQRELNFTVGRTIDRIIFLRICEDRGVEDYGQLMALQNGRNVYARLCHLFRRADERYNSGLFHYRDEKQRSGHPDVISFGLTIDDRTIKQIIKSLYYPESPYEFSVLSADILGQVYEQFLGKVIRLTTQHRAVVEDKPEAKKAGGVYYTPTYVVDYIIENTVGQLLKEKSLKQVGKLKILDPACGSGSFLIGAYQCLLDWHYDFYTKNGPEKWSKGRSPSLQQDASGGWRLTTGERKRILLDNIYGVDIDSQAVEVTKLSLLLKVLEGETEQTLTRQFRFFRERALPDLGNNIKCGNSLIGPDIYVEQQMSLLDENERFRINVFDWEDEFQAIMKVGGFNAVIGNPPWISLKGKFGAGIYPKHEIDYMIEKFSGNTYMPNMYEYFIAQGIRLIIDGGYFGYIVPDRLGFNSQFQKLRREILKQCQVLSLVYKVPFPRITADTLVFVFRRKNNPDRDELVAIGEYGKESLDIPQREFEQSPTHTFQYYENVEIRNVIKKIESSSNVCPLGNLCETTSGFGGRSSSITSKRTSNLQIETLKGDSIGRYALKKKYWFEFNQQNITGRTTNKIKLGAKPKILLRKTGARILATFDDSGIFPEQSLYFLFNNRSNLDFMYLLGILNSAVVNFLFTNRYVTNKRSIAQLKKNHLDEIPIPNIDASDPVCTACHSQMVELVEQILSLHRHYAIAKTHHEKTTIQRQIAATDQRIDRLVYDLYDLTEDEIQIVETEIS